MHANQEILRAAEGYRQAAKNYLERPPAPQLAGLAIPFYQKALALEPEHIETHLALARAYHELGQPEQAWRCCEQALTIAPASLPARFYRCMLQLPMLYRTESEVSAARQGYAQQLGELVDIVSTASRQNLLLLAEAIGRVTPFYLLYQGYDDRALMQCYGRLLTQVMAACYPQWCSPPPLEPPTAGQPIRVGVVSGLFYKHAIWKDVTKGWVSQLSQLDSQRFTLLGYSLGKTNDSETAYARTCFTKFVEGDRSLESWGQIIQADRPHVLIYPEVSMRKLSIQLSALRLAPIQCTTWATYVTSGLPTIDYFLSGALIEPPGAEAHYSEQLVRLPNTSMYYTPLTIAPEPLAHAAFGLRPGALIYFCGQSLYKYLPQYDCIYPRIAQALRAGGQDCQFVFLKSSVTEPMSKLFEKRLAAAFAAVGLDKDQHVVILPMSEQALPKISDGAYHRLNQLADLFLDSIGTGGATTTLEALAYDLPVVTWPGAFLRGHVSAGILRQIGVTATIADSLEHYLELAIRLGKDAPWRHTIRQQMAENKHRLYADQAPIEGLATLLERVVREGTA